MFLEQKIFLKENTAWGNRHWWHQTTSIRKKKCNHTLWTLSTIQLDYWFIAQSHKTEEPLKIRCNFGKLDSEFGGDWHNCAWLSGFDINHNIASSMGIFYCQRLSFYSKTLRKQWDVRFWRSEISAPGNESLLLTLQIQYITAF